MLLIFSTLQIVNLGEIIAVINITRVIILKIAIIITIMAISYKEKSVMFVVKKFVALSSIWMMNSRKQKSFGDKTKNSTEINANILHFWLIIKEI